MTGVTKKFGYTHVVGGTLRQSQEGAVRVNCMDSLDRTNVVQGAISRHTLINQVTITVGPLDKGLSLIITSTIILSTPQYLASRLI